MLTAGISARLPPLSPPSRGVRRASVRSRVVPPDDLPFEELLYLYHYYRDEDADERRVRLTDSIKRLARKGHDRQQLHAALIDAMRLRRDHDTQQRFLKREREWNADVARIRRALDRVLTSLRRLLPPRFPIDDVTLAELRDEFWVQPIPIPPTKRGRPWQWKQVLERALRQAGVTAEDRRELMAVVGFLDDDTRPPR